MESELLVFVLVHVCFAALPRVLLLPATLAVLGEQ